MKIIIKTTLGLATPLDLEVDPHEKISVVKERAATAQVVEPDKVELSHKNEILDENKTREESRPQYETCQFLNCAAEDYAENESHENEQHHPCLSST